MKEQIKAIFSDIDGTLLNVNRELSEKTINTIKALPAELPVILASSRMPKAMRHLQAELDIEDQPLVCYNGAYILATGKPEAEILYSTGIDAKTCRSIADLAEIGDIHVSLYSGEDWYVPALDYWAERERKNTKVSPSVGNPIDMLSQWSEEKRVVHKLMCMGEENEIEKLHQFLIKHFSQQIHAYRAKNTYIEIAPKTTSKAHAIKVLDTKLGIAPSSVLAFGDNYNDEEMIALVGFGIAVGNAKDVVKQVAYDITDKNTEDGVANAIEKLILT